MVARRGLSIFEMDHFRRGASSSTVPLFESPQIKFDLDRFLDLSVAKTVYSEALSDKDKYTMINLI